MSLEPRFDTVCISAPFNFPWTARSEAALFRAPNGFRHASRSDGTVKARLLEMPWHRRICVEASLPRLIYGCNRRALPAGLVAPALVEAVGRASRLFEEFAYVSPEAFHFSRLDMPIDLLIPLDGDFAFHLAKVGFPRRLKDKYVCGGGPRTFYSKHIVRGDPAPSSSLCIYFKRSPLGCGATSMLRCEARLRTPHIRRLLGQPLSGMTVENSACKLLGSSYELLKDEFKNLGPTSDADASSTIMSRPKRGKRDENSNRDLLELWEFGQAIGLTAVRRTGLFDDSALMATFRTFRSLGIGFGDPRNQSLVTFANVLKLSLSEQELPY